MCIEQQRECESLGKEEINIIFINYCYLIILLHLISCNIKKIINFKFNSCQIIKRLLIIFNKKQIKLIDISLSFFWQVKYACNVMIFRSRKVSLSLYNI